MLKQQKLSIVTQSDTKAQWRCITYGFEDNKKLRVAENDDKKRDRKSKTKNEHDKGLIVVLVASRVPVWSTGALETLWDIPKHTHRELVLFRRGRITPLHWV